MEWPSNRPDETVDGTLPGCQKQSHLLVFAAHRRQAGQFRRRSLATDEYKDYELALGDTGGFQGWDPGATPMTRVDDSHWSISLEFQDAETLEYKYTRGSWEAVEKDAGCGEVPNRTLTVEFEREGTQDVADSVEKWRDLDACG